MAYIHLSLEERHYIELQLKEGVSQNKIAKALGAISLPFHVSWVAIQDKEATDISKHMEKRKSVMGETQIR